MTMDHLLSKNGHRGEQPVSGARYYARDFWSDENLKYVEPHFRMLKAARIIERLSKDRAPSLLDIGCGPATLKRLVPASVKYHGIDIAIHDADPDLREADIVKGPIAFEGRTFDIVIAQGFFEYVGDYQSQKFDEIARLVAPGGTFIASYVNFGHRNPDVYERYSNVRAIEDFRADLSRNFVIQKSIPTSHNWSHKEPTRRFVRTCNMRLNVSLPFITPQLAVQYLFVCSTRPYSR
jgi:SAM-dependent methyltransferase